MKIEDKEELYSRLRIGKMHSLLGIHNLGVIIYFLIAFCLSLFLLFLLYILNSRLYVIIAIIIYCISVAKFVTTYWDFIKNKANFEYSLMVEIIKNLNKYNSMISSVKIGDFNIKEINKQYKSCKTIIQHHKIFYGVGKGSDGFDGIIDIMYNTYKNTNYTVTVIKKYANTHVRDEFIVLIAFEGKIDIKETQNSFLEQNNIKIWGKGSLNTNEKYIVLNKKYKHDKTFIFSNYTKECYFKRFDDIENLYQNIITYAEKVIDENE